MGKHTPEEIETAIRVLSQARVVTKRTMGLLKAFGIDPESEEGKKFVERENRRMAEELIKQ